HVSDSSPAFDLHHPTSRSRTAGGTPGSRCVGGGAPLPRTSTKYAPEYAARCVPEYAPEPSS
ncbi:hypothetical protein, partial [Streptomyces sp. FH025]|uniref:hypothetical protein n=1 Tax=Streptomyces sp. FH025 TaxID=2815937 RepID=UPI001A9E00D6